MYNQKKGVFFALLAVLGGGIYAIPYRLSLDTANTLPVIWGIFLCAFLFSLPGAWMARYQTKFSWKIVCLALATSVAGVIGKKKFIYDLWGDTVNVASRMEKYGKNHEIHISKPTYEIVKNKYNFSDRSIIDVKGKGQMETFFLKNRK